MIEFKKIKLLQAIIFLSTILGLWLQFYQNRKLEQDNERLNRNMENIHSSLTEFQLKDGRTGREGSVLELKLSELKQLYPAIISEIKNLKLKPSKVQSLSVNEIKSELLITTHLRDSIVFDTVQVKVFDYADNYYFIRGMQIGDTQKMQLSYCDTLTQIVYKGRRNKPWLWLLSPRKLEQRIALKSPNSKVLFSKVIQITQP